ncbi:hypothetical protein GCM10018791_44230 [Streptomyces zaomyceticus]|nr:hypothetical protein GCM10018791_44230 [Streptomyces zaomyceticus]
MVVRIRRNQGDAPPGATRRGPGPSGGRPGRPGPSGDKREGATAGRALSPQFPRYTQVSSHIRFRHWSSGMGVPV